MNNLEKYCGDCGYEFREDVEILKDTIPELTNLPARAIRDLYGNYSDRYGASWLMLDEETIENFRSWLLTEYS